MLPYLTALVLNTSATGFIIHRSIPFVKRFFNFFCKKLYGVDPGIFIPQNGNSGGGFTLHRLYYAFLIMAAMSSGVNL